MSLAVYLLPTAQVSIEKLPANVEDEDETDQKIYLYAPIIYIRTMISHNVPDIESSP